MWIVRLWSGCWIAPWSGDPGRTLVEDSAKRYKTEFAGHCAINRAERLFPNRDYSKSRVYKETE